MPMRATHMGLTCVAPSAPATESQRNVACLLKSIHPGLPRCDWVYRGGGGGAGREKRHGECSFVFYSIGVSERDVEEGITYNVVAYGLLLRSCRALYSTVVAIITACITLTSS